MKNLSWPSILALLTIIIFSCKKNDLQLIDYKFKVEPTSISKIENGDQYTFGSVNFTSTPELALQIKTAMDTANCSGWYVYLVKPNGNKYLVTGLGANGTSYYYVNRYYSATIKQLNIIIKKISGPDEEYSSILVTRYNWR